MRRRDFAKLLTVTPLAAYAQQQATSEKHLVALLPLADDALSRSRVEVLQLALAARGWRVGENLRFDVSWTGGANVGIDDVAASVIQSRPDVVMALGTVSVQALLKQTNTTPIVFVQVTDPVAAGFVSSLVRPGGNVTGLANFGASVSGDRLRLLKEIAPGVERALLLYESDYPMTEPLLRAAEDAATSLGIELTKGGVRDVAELERAVATFGREGNAGLAIVQGPFTTAARQRLVALAAEHRLPAVYPLAAFVEVGGLVSHGVNVPRMWESAGEYIDRILRGTRPSEIPIEEPTEPEIILNLQTAQMLGLEIPNSLRDRITATVG